MVCKFLLETEVELRLKIYHRIITQTPKNKKNKNYDIYGHILELEFLLDFEQNIVTEMQQNKIILTVFYGIP